MEALEPLLPAILSFGDREAALCAAALARYSRQPSRCNQAGFRV